MPWHSRQRRHLPLLGKILQRQERELHQTSPGWFAWARPEDERGNGSPTGAWFFCRPIIVLGAERAGTCRRLLQSEISETGTTAEIATTISPVEVSSRKGAFPLYSPLCCAPNGRFHSGHSRGIKKGVPAMARYGRIW